MVAGERICAADALAGRWNARLGRDGWPCTAVVRAQNAPLPAAPVPIASPAPAVVPAPAPALGTPVPFAPPAAPTPLTYTPPPPPALAFPVDPVAGWGRLSRRRCRRDTSSLPRSSCSIPSSRTASPMTRSSCRAATSSAFRPPAWTSRSLPKSNSATACPIAAGLFAASFRFFSGGDGSQIRRHCRRRAGLALETLDLDYGTTMFEVAPRWFIDWRIGLRLSDIYFDSSVRSVPCAAIQ